MQLATFVKFREESFGGVLFETQSEKVYTLNQAAAAVVREIGSGRSASDIAERLRQQFQDPGDQLGEDVHGLIASLQQKCLVHELPK